MGVGIVGCLTTEQFKTIYYFLTGNPNTMKYIFILIVCLINPIWGNPLPQSDSNFGNFGEEARGTDDELAEDPLGDIFGDILNGFGNLVQEGMKLITNVTESDGEITDAVAGAAKIGLDATQEVARIGIQA